jgi:hypothetical protein
MLDNSARLKETYYIQQLIDQALDRIIPEIRVLVKNSDLHNNRGFGKAQLANLQEVARDTESIEVIRTWVEYQIGRQPNKWQQIGPALLEHLDMLGVEAEAIAIDVLESASDDEARKYRMIRRVWLLLIRQYVGQLRRCAQ